MSTPNTVTDMSVKPEVVTFALTGLQTPDGNDAAGNPKFKTELKAISAEKTINEAKEKGIVLLEQSFSYDRVGTVAGILSVIPDEEEAVAIFNAGLKQKLNNRIKQLLEDVDDDGNPTFQPQEGNYDVRALLNEPAQRRNLSPVDRAVKTLTAIPGMTKEQLDSIVAMLRGQQ